MQVRAVKTARGANGGGLFKIVLTQTKEIQRIVRTHHKSYRKFFFLNNTTKYGTTTCNTSHVSSQKIFTGTLIEQPT